MEDTPGLPPEGRPILSSPAFAAGSHHSMHKETPLPETTNKICTLIKCAFAMGDIKADLLYCIVLLNSLSEHFPHARSIISCDIAASTDALPYTSMKIHQFLENKQSFLENDSCNVFYSLVALTARTKLTKLSNGLLCSNPICKKTSHTIEYCVKSGGGIAGKTLDESIAAHRASTKKKKSGSITLKIPITMKDMNGCAFTVMVNHNSSLVTNQPPEFIGVTYPATTFDEVEYEGWLVTEEEPTTTINWGKYSTPMPDTVFTIEPLAQTGHTRISLEDYPFIVDRSWV